MNNNQTIEKLKSMRLSAMAELHRQQLSSNAYQKCTPDEYLALLTESEWEDRQNKKITRLMKKATFKQQADMDEIIFSENRNLDKNMFNRLSSLQFIKQSENIIITGASGVGKSFMSQAIGRQACLMSYNTIYQVTARLFNKMKLAKVDGTYIKELKRITSAQLLILDDFGLQSMDNMAREVLMDIIDDRHGKTSTIISSQIPVSAWYDIIGEGTIADAILDRLVNSSHRIDLKGESLRKGMLKH
ncbi:IS21-like element helper ATPase IstB [Fulvivirga maritima]|uniref:IS21-like element helper ATPase IstB n=1 Tax=Fulvivirga maritima TaxID=2904247 RepID=UPI001F2DEF8C|nr:IS21-like element helper ATPase IstB [Fulvivirga maritima]UII27643.1 IS21-like element helper ATPase IstB [Fulvivirga maritima]